MGLRPLNPPPQSLNLSILQPKINLITRTNELASFLEKYASKITITIQVLVKLLLSLLSVYNFLCDDDDFLCNVLLTS